MPSGQSKKMNNKKIISPITDTENTVLEKTIDCNSIINKYKNIDSKYISVERFFKGLNYVELYKCLETDYRFFYPFSVAGDDKLYKDLAKMPWYYQDWKWEYETASKYINNGDSILEIGCGKGSFIKKLRENGSTVEGLEMNIEAISTCKKDGLLVHLDSIESFSKNKHEKYDVVCSFQVLEHVYNVKSFLDSSINTLKPGGLLIIGVPNNDSLIFDSEDYIALNIPPHHMGLWNTNSLIKLQEYFDIKIESIYLEPFRKSDFGIIANMIKKNYKKKISSKFDIFSKLVDKLIHKSVNFGAVTIARYLPGHSILAIFRKNNF